MKCGDHQLEFISHLVQVGNDRVLGKYLSSDCCRCMIMQMNGGCRQDAWTFEDDAFQLESFLIFKLV